MRETSKSVTTQGAGEDERVQKIQGLGCMNLPGEGSGTRWHSQTMGVPRLFGLSESLA